MTGLRESGKNEKKELRKKCRMKAKGLKVVIEKLKQRISAKSEKLRFYRARDNQYMQNKLFRCNQKALYQELDGKVTPAQVPSNAEEAKDF